MVLARILSIKDDQKIDVSLKESLVLYKPREVKENSVFRAIVKEKRESIWMVTLLGANCKAELKGYFKDIALKEEILVKVVKVRDGRVHVANKSNDIEPLTDDKDENVAAVWESVLEIKKNAMELESSEPTEEEMEEEEIE